jgi:hypothetical protein
MKAKITVAASAKDLKDSTLWEFLRVEHEKYVKGL